MKKYTLPLCGLAISLGVASSAIAAPVTGSQTISGTLTAPTCTISLPTDYKVPDVTISEIDAKILAANMFEKTGIGGVNIENCDNVSASAMAAAGFDPTGPGNGRFTYDNVAEGSTITKEPLVFQVRRQPNPSISDSRREGIFNMNGGNLVVLKNGDTLNFTLVKGRPGAGRVESSYIGGYHGDVTFTFNYS